MPRQPRLDVSGTLHHVMGRGIERTKIFQNKTDRDDFSSHLANAEVLPKVKRYLKLI